MSLAWRLLQDEIKNGRFEIVSLNIDDDVVQDVQKSFAKPLDLKFGSRLENGVYQNNDCGNVDESRGTAKDNSITVSQKSGIHNSVAGEKVVSSEAVRVYRIALKGLKNKKRANNKGQRSERRSRIYREILYQRLSTNFAIPTEDFRSFVKDIMDEEFPGYLIEKIAIEALQRESEMMITKMLCLANHLAIHAKRETVMTKDLKLLKFLFKKNKEGCSFEV